MSGYGDGLIKIIHCPDSNRLLGSIIIGAHASELIVELTLALKMGATLDDIAHTIHAHPSLSETNALATEVGLDICVD